MIFKTKYINSNNKYQKKTKNFRKVFKSFNNLYYNMLLNLINQKIILFYKNN